MTAHAKLSASGSARWLTCTGSVKAESQFPNTSSSMQWRVQQPTQLAERCLAEDIAPSYYLNQHSRWLHR
jgi:hypothetical protein